MASMKESAAAKVSAMTSATLTVGTIHLGARAGTRTMLASIVDRLVFSARIFKQRVATEGRPYSCCPTGASNDGSLENVSYNFINNVNRSPRTRHGLLLDLQAKQVGDIFDSYQPPFPHQLF